MSRRQWWTYGESNSRLPDLPRYSRIYWTYGESNPDLPDANRVLYH